MTFIALRNAIVTVYFIVAVSGIYKIVVNAL